MGVQREMLMTLFQNGVISKVWLQFEKGPEYLPIESYGMTFRLNRLSEYQINLEVVITHPIAGTTLPY